MAKSKKFAWVDWLLPEEVEVEEKFPWRVNPLQIANWLTNIDINFTTLAEMPSVNSLPKINGSALIIDKSMMSEQYFEQLPAIKDYKGTIFVCDRALYTVIEHRLPEYVLNVDSSSLCFSFYDRPDVVKIMDKVTAIFAATTNPITIRLWHGKQAFFLGPIFGGQLLAQMMKLTGLPVMNTGGQVASTAYLMAYNMGANPIGLYGITNCYSKMSESEFPAAKHEKINGYGTCYRDPIYKAYNEEFLKFAAELKSKGITTVNCSKAGLVYSDSIVDLSLKQFIGENQK